MGARAIAEIDTLAEPRGTMSRVLGWGAGSSHTDRDPSSDRREVQRVRALHHGTGFDGIIQTECRCRTRHLECITEGRHIEQGFTYHKETSQDMEKIDMLIQNTKSK